MHEAAGTLECHPGIPGGSCPSVNGRGLYGQLAGGSSRRLQRYVFNASLCLQSDASTERLLQRVMSPAEGLEAHFQWREDDERIAVEQAAMWMAQPASGSVPMDDAMDVDMAQRWAEAATSGMAAAESAAAAPVPPAGGMSRFMIRIGIL